MTAADDLSTIANDLQALTTLVALDANKPPIAAPRAIKIRLAELTRGGHRPASFSTGPGGGDTILPVRDRDEKKHARIIGRGTDHQHADLSDSVVRSDPADDEIIKLQQEYTRSIRRAADALGNARCAQQKILARARIKADADTNPVADDAWCLSCLRLDVFNPRGNPKRQGTNTVLCRWCDENQTDATTEAGITENGQTTTWPPLELLTLHHQAQARGSHITTKMLTEAGLTTTTTTTGAPAQTP